MIVKHKVGRQGSFPGFAAVGSKIRRHCHCLRILVQCLRILDLTAENPRREQNEARIQEWQLTNETLVALCCDHSSTSLARPRVMPANNIAAGSAERESRNERELAADGFRKR